MSALEAIHTVLEQAGEPLHYKEITRRILDQGLLQTSGKTPWDSVHSRMAVDILTNGVDSRFQRTAKGIFALRAWGLPEYTPTKKGSAPNQSSPEPPQPPSKPKTIAKTYSFTDAAEKVLQDHGNRQPMHYRTITEIMLAEKLVNTHGQTPEATLYSLFLQEIKRKRKLGELPRFVNHGKGHFGLSRWMAKGLAFQIQQHNKTVRAKLLAQLKAMDWADFEELIGQLLVAMGLVDVNVTPKGGDGGIDVRGTLVVGEVIRTRMAVQVKRWKGNVQSPIVQQVRGSLGVHEQGLIITTSDFSSGARKEAARAGSVPIALMNGEELVSVLIENDIGIERNSYDLLDLIEKEANQP